jgi:ABC-type lipopolysaccharide export system ATPase subunit
MSQLKADSIYLEFDNKRILNGAFIECTVGEVIGLFGRNGTGKSCLLRIMYGTLQAEKNVRIDAKSIRNGFENGTPIAYLPQQYFVPGTLTVSKVLYHYKISLQKFLSEIPSLKSDINSKVVNLSGGNRRILEIYVVLNCSNKFILLDEPFTYLSPITVETVQQLILKAKASKGIIVTDHQYRNVLSICDKQYLLKDGYMKLCTSQQDLVEFGYILNLD